MGKRKFKGRKNRSNQNAKPQRKPVSQPPDFPPRSNEAEMAEGEGSSRIHPSMGAEVRYPSFNAYCRDIRLTLPDDLKTFSISDVPESKHKLWLKRHLEMRKRGDLDRWRTELLDRIGFEWSLGEEPETRKSSRAKERDEEWWALYEKLREQLEGSSQPIKDFIGLDDDLFRWGLQQLSRASSNQLSGDKGDKISKLLPDFSPSTRWGSLRLWRKSLQLFERVYDQGHKERESIDPEEKRRADHWADKQRKFRKSEELEEWKIALLDELGFDWTYLKGEEAMYARWFEKLERLVELEAQYGKPIPSKVAISSGLLSWISRMREHYAKGTLPDHVLKPFLEKGFEFDGMAGKKRRQKQNWDQRYRQLKKYYQEFGHARIPASFAENPDLGSWLAHQRERMRLGIIAPDKRKALEALGVTERSDGRKARRYSPWRKMYATLKEAAERPDGKATDFFDLPEKIRAWLRRQRTHSEQGRLEEWQIRSLADIGFDLTQLPKKTRRSKSQEKIWNSHMDNLRSFVSENGHARVPKADTHKSLYLFVQRTRQRYRKNKLSASQVAELKEIGFAFDPTRSPTRTWMNHYAKLKAYHSEHGNARVPRRYEPDQSLAEFVAQQKQWGRTGKLNAEHIRLLDELDFPWIGGHPEPRDKQD